MIRTKIGYLFLLAILLILSILYDEYVMMFVFLTVLMVPVLLWMVMLLIRYFVDISLESDNMIVEKGAAETVTVRIVNRSVLPISLLKMSIQYENLLEGRIQEEKMIAVIDARCEQKYRITLNSDYCGVIEFSFGRIKIYDYLGIWCVRKKIEQKVKVTVLPQIHLIEEPIVLENPSVLVESDLFSNTKSGDDSSELFGIKDYEYGDKMNRIHWKLSLKEDKLMVKQFGLPINCSVALFVDLYYEGNEGKPVSIPMKDMDSIMETMVSFSFSLILQEQIHYLVWYDTGKETCRRIRIEKEEELYEALAILFQGRRRVQNKSLATYHEAQYEKEQYTNIFYLAGLATKDATEAMVRSRKNAWTHFIYMEHKNKEQEALEHGMTASVLSATNLYVELNMLPGEWRGR